MLIYDVLNKEKVYQIVANDLRNLGVKRRVKKQTAIKPSPNLKQHTVNPDSQSLKKVFKTHLSHLPLDVVKLSSGAIVHVPHFVSQACSYVEKCVTHEGIFRKAGSHLRQREIISRLDAGAPLGDKYQVVDVANVLKTFFRELPEPLIPWSYHDVFLRCALLKNSRIDAILMACILLPPHHLNTLAFFAEFLKRVAKNEKHNKMGVDNLAKVVGPNLMPLQETTMSAIQSRLETHLIIVKILIENSERIGILPEHVADQIASEGAGSVETELDASDSLLRSKNKKKKRRSGSLTRKTHLSASNLNLRMLNGLKKMVSKGGSPDEAPAASSRVLSTDFNPAHTPSIKTGKKRKVAEPAAPLSAKKKREVLQTMPDGCYPRQGNLLASLVSIDPNPCKEKSPVQKSRVKKYLSQKVHSDAPVGEKLEKSKKIRLSLDRLVSKSKQKLADLDPNNHDKISNSPKIERRWSSVSGSSWSKKKRGAYEGLAVQSLSKAKNNLLEDAYDQDEVFMEADVNLSDDNDGPNDRISEELMDIGCKNDSEVAKSDAVFDSNFSRCLLPYNLMPRMEDDDPGPEFHDIDVDVDQRDEEYVTIPKSEYEEIKNRVSAIESRISQEFGCISTNADQNLTQSSASKVQSEYEKTLEEASIGNTATADHLAKRLGKELKIRRSAEHKIIRSPSARKIGNLRRRSQEKPISKRGSRHVSWLVSKQACAEQPKEQLNNFCPKASLKRGRPNTVYTGLMQPNSQSLSNSDTTCSDETNARLDFLQKQLHALITHTVEHTKGSLSDEEVFISDRDEASEASDNILRTAVRRASSFHGSEFIDNSRHFNKKMRELKKSSSQHDVSLNNERMAARNKNTGNIINVDKIVNWKDADCYFSSDYKTRTPAPQTGRASVAKLRTQNAGMVLAKAKLFDDSSKRERSCEEKSGSSNRRQIVKLGRTREAKCLDLDTSSNVKKTGTPRKKHSKSPKNSNAKLKLLHSSGSSPLIKMELTIMPSQQSVQQSIDKRAGRNAHGVQKFSDRQRLEFLKNDVKTERSYKENRNVVLTSLENPRSPDTVLNETSKNILEFESSTPCKTPHIKRPLTLKTPKDAKNLIRKHGIDTRRTPMKAVALNSTQLTTPRRQSPRSALKSRQLTRSVS